LAVGVISARRASRSIDIAGRHPRRSIAAVFPTRLVRRKYVGVNTDEFATQKKETVRHPVHLPSIGIDPRRRAKKAGNLAA
jgi:hypothetical protein